MGRIRRALLSVSDKRGIVDLARELASMDIVIMSTGGTARALRDAGVAVQEVSDYTGFPEMMDGRLKTLHPKIHGGLLGRRNRQDDLADMEKHGIEPIDMVVVNLYPFEATIAKEGVTFEEAIENIDIGGPTMLRAASKNFHDVAVVVDPDDYEWIVREMKSLKGELGYKHKARLALKVFQHTSRYDSMIADYLAGMSDEPQGFPRYLTFSYKLRSELRYGENPHQRAAAYVETSDSLNIFKTMMHQGLDMSFNNYADANAALLSVLEFKEPACAIVRHGNPCGVALGEVAAEAFLKAYQTDPQSAYGGVLALNVPLDAEAAREMAKVYLEVVLAPAYGEGALEALSARPGLRVLELPEVRPLKGWDFKRVAGGVLVQDFDSADVDIRSLRAVTRRQPAAEEIEGLEFAWKVCRHVGTNAIVYALKDRTLGIGIGQSSIVYSARVGAINAQESLRGSVVASDGFVPSRDALEGISKAGATAVIQSGGSPRDAEVIEAADEMDVAMIFTGVRRFSH